MNPKTKLVSFLLFLISPILSIPFVIYLIANRQKIGFLMLSIIFGLIGYMYKPSLSADLSRYYYYYDYVINMNLDEFMFYLENKTDIGMHVFQFIISRWEWSFQIYVLLVTILNTSLLFKVYMDRHKKFEFSNSLYLLFFLFFLSFTGLSWIIGASRYFTAASIVIYSYNFGIFRKKKKYDLIIFSALLFHFSAIIYIILYFIAKYVHIKYDLLVYIFYFSFIFYLVPKTSIQGVIKSNISYFIDEDGTYDNKVSVYALDENDLAQNESRNKINLNGRVIKIIIGTLPFIFISLYSLFGNIAFDKYYYILFIFVNFTNYFDSISGRSFWILSVIFSLYFINDIMIKNKITLDRFLFIFFIIFIKNFSFIIGYRDQLVNIFFDSSILSSGTILLRDVSYQNLFN